MSTEGPGEPPIKTPTASSMVMKAGATFASASDLAAALRRAEVAHREHEKRTGQRDAAWADWYAQYMVAEQARR
jgi:hypothetical protein